MTDATQVSLDELLMLRLQAAHCQLAARRSRQAAAGQHASHVYGRGMNYAESRAYQAGDDVRHLDWRLTARSGKMHTKLFEEDRQSSLILLLDTHATMRFGTRRCFKSVTAARAAALAAWIASRGGERVGLLSFGDNARLIKPAAGKRAALAICAALVDTTCGATSDSAHRAASNNTPIKNTTGRAPYSHQARTLDEQLRLLRGLTPRPDRLLLISDGFAIDAAATNALALAAKHSHLSLLGIADALETAPPPAGNYRFQLGGKPLAAALFGRNRRAFFEQLNKGQQQLQQLGTKRHLAYRLLTATDDPVTALRPLLAGGRAK